MKLKSLKNNILKPSIDDVIVVAYALKHGLGEDYMDSPEATLVLEAIKRSTDELSDDASIQDVGQYVQNLDEAQMQGFVSNVKGIYHEIQFAYNENNDADSISAELFEETNHPGSDVILYNPDTNHREYVQLKATDSPDLIYSAIEKYPNIRVAATEEVASKMGIDSTGMSNEELNQEIESVLQNLGSEKDILDYMPNATIWTSAFAIFPIIKKYLNKQITRQDCIRIIVKITGIKVVKVSAMLLLLSFPPTAVATSSYLFIKYIIYLVGVYKERPITISH